MSNSASAADALRATKQSAIEADLAAASGEVRFDRRQCRGHLPGALARDDHRKHMAGAASKTRRDR
ncbi:MAG: hypothetical protein H8E44_39985, partial [Planctomycetes bacterium]|nr:hypothetical protein [Planctomycetota bacterium]